MVPVWPFKKKSNKSRISRQRFVTNVVEYERKKGKGEKGKESDKDHLQYRKFLDAMKLLSKKED